MIAWLIALAAGVAAAALGYLPRTDAATRPAWVPMVLRGIAVALLVAVLADAPIGTGRAQSPLAALDVSASWQRGHDSVAWGVARDTAAAIGADRTFLFGDSARAGPVPAAPTDRASVVQPAVERTLASGRPLVVITDGEIADPEALVALPAGSRVVVVPRRSEPDAAIAMVDAPQAVVVGDTLEVRVDVTAGALGASRGTLRVTLDDAPWATAALDSLPAWGERSVRLHGRVSGTAGPAILRAVLAVAGDVEPRNDTLAVALDVAAQASVVFVSTAPDADVRWLVALLRGAVALPTRAYYRVAPGQWRAEGTLAPVAEDDIRRAVRDAPLVVLHGDTALFGAPLVAARGTLALLAPPRERTGEWFASGAPPSPVAAALSGVLWDSLPPLDLAAAAPHGDWIALEAQQAKDQPRRAVIAGRLLPRRTVVVAATGWARWRVRTGYPADAFAALWGGIFDWLAAERPDVRAVVPAGGVVREGDAWRWRRGSARDSTVSVVLHRRGASTRDTLRLRFVARATETETPPLPVGTYDVSAGGGVSVVVVNRGTEWLPRRPTVRTGRVGEAATVGDAPRLRARWWAFAVVLALLCVEWVLRRRAGLR